MLPPDFEIMKISSAFAPIKFADCAKVLKTFGSLSVGGIGYSPSFDADGNPKDGFLALTTSIPLLSLDLSDPTSLLLHLHILPRAADTLEQQVSALGTADAF